MVTKVLLITQEARKCKQNLLFGGRNGYLAFVSGDTDHFETFENHFALPRISALFHDLDPSAGGTVSFKQLDDRIVVTFEDVPEYGWANRNSFQIEMLYNGKIRITFTDIDTYDGIVGLSKGCGISSCFAESDLSEYAVCNLAADFNPDLDIGLTDFAIFADLWRLQYENGGIETVRDEFGSGSYSGNDGTADFAGDWRESGESDGPARGVIRVIDRHNIHSLCIGDRSKTVHPVICLTRQADLTAETSPTLTYDYEVHDEGGAGAVSVQISADGGQTWDTLADYDYNAGAGSASFDVTAYASPDTMIRLETGSQLKMYLYVDNVQIEYYMEPWFYNCDLNQDFSIDCLDLAVFADNWLN